MKQNSLKVFFLINIITLVGCSSSPRFTNDSESSNRIERIKDRTSREDEKSYERNNNSVALESTIAIASFYSDKFHGRKTANGETYDMYALTAAHINYPFNTEVRVTNLTNNKSVVLRINDRKPDTNGRAIDLSYRAAELLDMVTSGIAKVQVEVLEWGEFEK